MGSPLHAISNNGEAHEVIALAHPSGSRASVSTHGAQVLSWIDPLGNERLYLSRKASYAPATSIRGGIPVVFPQFATGPLPKHGLVRTRRWSVVSQNESSVTLRITDDDETRALWPYHFQAELTASLGEMLTVRLAITNTGNDAFTFTAALHNYFRTSRVETASVVGLGGLIYQDKTLGIRCLEEQREVRIRAETDRIYQLGPRQVAISHAIGTSTTVIGADGFGDWVVWNPWRDLTATLTDMEPKDYLHMLCVEAARIAEPVTLDPRSSWVGMEVIGAT